MCFNCEEMLWSNCVCTEKLDLSIISSLVDATLHTLEDVLQPAAKWVLDLQEVKDNTVGIKFNSGDVASFQSQVTEPFYIKLKENIQNRFISQDVVSCFSIFDPKKTPTFSENCTCGEDQVKVLLEHYGSELPAETVVGDEFLTSSSDLPRVENLSAIYHQSTKGRYQGAVERVVH